MINAIPHQLRKRGTLFNRCHPFTTPDPPVYEKPATYICCSIYTVSGTLIKDITAEKTILLVDYGDFAAKKPYILSHIKQGYPFTITAKDVPTLKLPDSYLIGAVVGIQQAIQKNH
ncbi:hypothetical protein C1646_758114 [Rhizophagus diaphanus]|nr:hypothetical protein C1646_758114 [Rhizophagus diaphanus] [Rhizophagus sp. MUCL 43196]